MKRWEPIGPAGGYAIAFGTYAEPGKDLFVAVAGEVVRDGDGFKGTLTIAGKMVHQSEHPSRDEAFDAVGEAATRSIKLRLLETDWGGE